MTSDERYAEAAMAPVTTIPSMWAVTLCGEPEGKYGTHKLFYANGKDATEAERVALEARPGSHLHPDHRTVWSGGLMPAHDRTLPDGWKYVTGTMDWWRPVATLAELVAALHQLPPNVERVEPMGDGDALHGVWYYPARNTVSIL